jgi:crotonobetainyl-CoA:carnitine CoA-transferase CaiB-like acyl-CoA transferase
MSQVKQNDQSGTRPFARTGVVSREHALSGPICTRPFGRTGAVRPGRRGGHVKVAMHDTLANWMTYPRYRTAYNGSRIPRLPINNANRVPYGAHATRYGKVVFSIHDEREWWKFCKVVMAHPELDSREDYRTNNLRIANAEKLTKLIEAKDLWGHSQLQERDKWRDVMTPGDKSPQGFDSLLAGLGGCQFALGASKNIVTEDLVFMLDSTGFDNGIHLERLMAARQILSQILPDERLQGNVFAAGIPKDLYSLSQGHRSGFGIPRSDATCSTSALICKDELDPRTKTN